MNSKSEQCYTSKDKIQEEIKKKEQSILRELAKIEDQSLETINNLQKQGEQLHAINKNIDNIHHELALSEKIIKKMSSIFPILFGKPEISNVAISKEETTLIVNTKLHQTNQIKKEYKTKIDEEKKKDSLDIMLLQLNKIKQNAYIQSELLDQHNKKLDTMTSNTQKASDKIKQINKKIKDI